MEPTLYNFQSFRERTIIGANRGRVEDVYFLALCEMNGWYRFECNIQSATERLRYCLVKGYKRSLAHLYQLADETDREDIDRKIQNSGDFVCIYLHHVYNGLNESELNEELINYCVNNSYEARYLHVHINEEIFDEPFLEYFSQCYFYPPIWGMINFAYDHGYAYISEDHLMIAELICDARMLFEMTDEYASKLAELEIGIHSNRLFNNFMKSVRLTKSSFESSPQHMRHNLELDYAHGPLGGPMITRAVSYLSNVTHQYLIIREVIDFVDTPIYSSVIELFRWFECVQRVVRRSSLCAIFYLRYLGKDVSVLIGKYVYRTRLTDTELWDDLLPVEQKLDKKDFDEWY